jgi:hypothetical protein
MYVSPCHGSDLPCVKKNKMTCAKMTDLIDEGVAWMGSDLNLSES